MARKTISFEEKLARLEEIQQQIHEGGRPIKETFELFEEGLKLSNDLEKEINKYEKKIEILTEENIDESE